MAAPKVGDSSSRFTAPAHPTALAVPPIRNDSVNDSAM
jgi:hypothetical protein